MFRKAKKSLENYSIELQEMRRSQQTSGIHEMDLASVCVLLGRVLCVNERTSDEGIKYYEIALEIVGRLLGDHDLKLSCYKEIGDSYFRQGRHAEAVKHYGEALKVTPTLVL